MLLASERRARGRELYPLFRIVALIALLHDLYPTDGAFDAGPSSAVRRLPARSGRVPLRRPSPDRPLGGRPGVSILDKDR